MRKVLVALAEILDNGHISNYNPFLGQQICDSEVALWAYLAAPNTETSENPNSKAILTAFARLPDHIRILLGPILAKKFTDSGDLQSTDVVLRTAKRTLIKVDPALNLAQANVDILQKNFKAAADQISLIAKSGTDSSPQALIDLVENQILSGQVISPDIPDLIAAYLAEYRKSKIAPKLQRAYILSLAITGRFDESFSIYSKYLVKNNVILYSQTLPQVLFLLAKRADDITFLRHSLSRVDTLHPGLSIELQNTLASRLIDLGFLEQASKLLMRDGKERVSSSRKLMNAQVLIYRNLPNRALAELLGVSSPLAGSLRTEAYLSIEKYESAGLSQESGGLDSSRSFWHADNWETVLQQKDSQFFDAANLAKDLGEAKPKDRENGSLTYAQALAESSLSTRSNIGSLLKLTERAP